MLTYLDSLCEAMATRDLSRLHNLVDDHPLARLLPAEAMREVRRFLAQKVGRHAVPLMTLRFRDRTARLLGELPSGTGASTRAVSAPIVPAVPRRRQRSGIQTELPLSA